MATDFREDTDTIDAVDRASLRREQTEIVNACEARIGEVSLAMRDTFRQLVSVARDYIRTGSAAHFIKQMKDLLPAEEDAQ